MAQRSMEAYKFWREAQLKYDYYIVGLIAAIFTYSVSKYTPQKIALLENSFELLGIIFLFVSLYYGIKRLEIDLVIQSISVNQATTKEKLRIARKVEIEGSSHDLDNGGVITKQDAQKTISECWCTLPILQSEFSSQTKTSEAYFNCRNKLMVLGLVFLVLAKCIRTIYITAL